MMTSILSAGEVSRTLVVITKVESMPLMAPLSGEVTSILVIVAAPTLPTSPKPTRKAASSNKHLLPFIISSSGKNLPVVENDKTIASFSRPLNYGAEIQAQGILVSRATALLSLCRRIASFPTNHLSNNDKYRHTLPQKA
jgi:hypothetical protein